MFAMLLPVHVWGGMEVHSFDLAKGMAKAGHDIVVITSRHPKGIKKEVIEGVEVHYVDVYPTSKKPLGRESIRKLEQLHAEKKFDVIHSQVFSAFYYIKDGLKQKLGVPLVTTLHGTPYSEIRTPYNEIKGDLKQGLSLMIFPRIIFHLFTHFYLIRRMVEESDALIAVSKDVADNILDEFKINKSKVRVVYNGIDTEKFKPSESRLKGKFQGKKILLSVSVLHRRKGIQNLIKALRKVVDRIPETHLIVVGKGPYRKNLEKLTHDLKLEEHVTFAGWIPDDELKDYYNLCDVFVQPTLYVEAYGLVVAEAMSCGKPPVASRIGGLKNIIQDGFNGLFVEPGNIEELADRIEEVLGDKELAKRLGDNALKTVEEKFSISKMASGTIKVYESVRGV
ncbi:MAG: glycosyltransferase family 4 protein [Candidatus Altiarchaeota archaeon]|nr:glycosyltransferase family 4 protein [Candidatus Altiarchaeota archaeon]